MAEYKVIRGGDKYIRSIFERIKRNPEVRFVYTGDTILNANNTISGIVYEPIKKKMQVWGSEKDALVRIFNDKLLNNKKIKLEKIVV